MRLRAVMLLTAAVALDLGATLGSTDPATVWNREELYKVPKSWKNQDPFRGEVTPMWLEGEPYRGKPTRLFTFLGLPEGASPSNKVPGIVLVHGGLGTAYPEWVRLWTRRGYAAITVDNCGQLPAMGADGKWMANPDGGPRGWGEEAVKHLDEPLREQWMYHAIAASVRAHSYLRSLDCVDAANVGVTGISWGGFQTCILAALDERFAYAVPVYGCGFNDEPGGIMSAERYGARGPAWSKLWDPVRFLPYVKVPLLWVDGTNDHAFSLDRVMRSADLAKGESQFCTRLRMVHAHGAPGEAPAEILAFADHYARGAKDIVRVTSAKLEGGEMVVKFTANGRRLVRAELLWTCDGAGTPYPERRWESRELKDFAPERGCVRVRLEKGTAQALVNLIADDGLIFSSRTLKTSKSAAVGTAGAATFTGETSNPHNSCFALGSEARACFEAKGFPPGSEQRLDVRFFDDEERELAGDAVSRAVRIGADGAWRGEVALPTKTLGFRRVRATLGGVTLPAVGSRPKGCLTYLVAPDPKTRRLLSETGHFLGLHGELAGETALMPWIGARWQLRGLGPYATDEEYRKVRAAADKRGWTYYGFYSPQVSHLKFERSQWAPADRAWAEKHGDDQWNYFTTPEGREVYRHVIQDKVRASLRQPFYTKARIWETMWEPELSAKPEVLVEAVRYSTALIKEIDPDAKIAIPTVSGLKKMDYYRQIFERGILDCADVFDMHFYAAGMPPEENGYVRQVRELVKMVRKYAGRKIPMIATEGGYNTKATREEEFKQMTGIVRMLLVLLGEGFDFALPFYGSDYGGDYADRAEGDWGVTYNLELPKRRFGPRHVSPRPVLAALSGFGLMVDGSRPTACLECLGEKALGYAFQDAAGEVTLALWCWGETPAEVELPVGVARVRVGDIFGNLTEQATEDGVFRTKLSAKPIYVKGASAALWGRSAVHALRVERTSLAAVAGARVTLRGTADRAGTLEVRPAASLGLSRFTRELTPGAFSVELELPAQMRDGDYPVTLVFREGRKIVSLSGVRIAVDAPVKIRNVRPTAAGDDPALAVTLENMTDAAKAGVVTLRVGEEPLARRSQAVELAPGAVRTVEVACPGWRPDPFATLEAVVAFDTPGAMRTETRRSVDFLTAACAPGVGKSVALEDWPGIRWLPMPRNVARKPEFTRDGNDLSAKLALGWNEDFFLVAVDVVDDDPVPPARGAWWLWRGDAVQVAFAKDVLAKPSENAWADALDQAMTENAIGLAPEGPQVARTVSYDPTRFPCDINGDAAIVRDAPVSVTRRNRPEGGVVWSYRAAFPWKYMNKTSAAAGETVYFAAAVNDLDRDQKDLSGLSVFELKKQAPRGFGAVCLGK